MKNENIMIKFNIHIKHICLTDLLYEERKEQIIERFLLTY